MPVKRSTCVVCGERDVNLVAGVCFPCYDARVAEDVTQQLQATATGPVLVGLIALVWGLLG